MGNISSIKLQLTALTSQIKGVEKQVTKKMKQLDKELKKNKIKEIDNHLDLQNQQKFHLHFVNLWLSQKEVKWLELK